MAGRAPTPPAPRTFAKAFGLVRRLIASPLPGLSPAPSARVAEASYLSRLTTLLCLPEYTDVAKVFAPAFDTLQPLYQIRFAHPRYPSIFDEIRQNLQHFLQMRHEEDTKEPATIEEFENRWSVKLIVTNDTDVDLLGHEAGSMAFYLAGLVYDLCCFLMFLDSFIAWRAASETMLSSAQKLEVTVTTDVYLHMGPKLEFEMPTKLFSPSSAGRNLKQEALLVQPPTRSRRCILATLHAKGENQMGVIFSGALKGLKFYFKKAGIPGKYLTKPGPNPEYHRCIQAIPLTDQRKRMWLKQVMSAMVLQCTICAVRTKGQFPRKSAVESFLEELAAMPHLIFVAPLTTEPDSSSEDSHEKEDDTFASSAYKEPTGDKAYSHGRGENKYKTYACWQCNRTLPATHFPAKRIQMHIRLETVDAMCCVACQPDLRRAHHILDNTGYRCKRCKKTKHKKEFTDSVHTNKNLKDWVCRDCQYPECSACGSRPTRPMHGQIALRSYRCRPCTYPPCIGCGAKRPEKKNFKKVHGN